MVACQHRQPALLTKQVFLNGLKLVPPRVHRLTPCSAAKSEAPVLVSWNRIKSHVEGHPSQTTQPAWARFYISSFSLISGRRLPDFQLPAPFNYRFPICDCFARSALITPTGRIIIACWCLAEKRPSLLQARMTPITWRGSLPTFQKIITGSFKFDELLLYI